LWFDRHGVKPIWLSQSDEQFAVKRRKVMKIAVIGVLATVGTALGQTGVMDQTSPWNPAPPVQSASFNLDAAFLIWQQQIRAGVGGQLEGVRLMFDSGESGASIQLRIRLEAAWATAPEVFSATITKATAGQEFVFVDTTSANIQLTANDAFVVEMNGTGTGVWLRGNYAPPPNTPAYPEPLFLLSSPQGDGNWRFGFETYMLAGSQCYPNCDGSTIEPILNVADFSCFLSRFAAGDPYANCDGSTIEPVLNVADFSCFLGKFAAGCP
jgi:hypothetical protein